MGILRDRTPHSTPMRDYACLLLHIVAYLYFKWSL